MCPLSVTATSWGRSAVSDHICSEAESETARTTGRALNALKKAQDADIRLRVFATRFGEYPRKLTTNVVGIREPDKLYLYSVCFEHDAARPVEHMQALVHCKQRIGYAAPFVITGNEQDRHSRRCEAPEWGECRFRQPRWYAASVQEVAAVDDYIDLAGARGLERTLEILEEVVAPSPPDHARPCGPIETDVRVGHEQDTHVTPTRARRRAENRRAQAPRHSAAPPEHQPQPGV